MLMIWPHTQGSPFPACLVGVYLHNPTGQHHHHTSIVLLQAVIMNSYMLVHRGMQTSLALRRLTARPLVIFNCLQLTKGSCDHSTRKRRSVCSTACCGVGRQQGRMNDNLFEVLLEAMVLQNGVYVHSVCIAHNHQMTPPGRQVSYCLHKTQGELVTPLSARGPDRSIKRPVGFRDTCCVPQSRAQLPKLAS